MRVDHSKAFLTAANYLPERLWRAAFSLSQREREICEEIRIRRGRQPKALVGGRYIALTYKGAGLTVTKEDIEDILQRATKGSVHTYSEQINNGYITTDEGHRIGVSGEILCENETVRNVKSISCVNIRIAKPCIGTADGIVKYLYTGGFVNTLIISEPGGGKTTLLRDMCRALSKQYNISIVDERYEIAGNRSQKFSFDIGDCDVVSGGTKQRGIETMIRSMSPQIIALDEITEEKDVDMICRTIYCGCRFLATAHTLGIKSFYNRPIYKKLVDSDIFDNILYIDNENGKRHYYAYVREAKMNDKSDRNTLDSGIMLGDRYFSEQRIPAEG